jgi:hypothetical protein
MIHIACAFIVLLGMWSLPATAQEYSFDDFINNLGKLFDLPTLTPEALEKTAPIKVELQQKCETSQNETTDAEGRSLQLATLYPYYPPCVAESDLVAKFGRPAERRQSSLRHFAPGQKPPPGLRPTSDQVSYNTPPGITITFV